MGSENRMAGQGLTLGIFLLGVVFLAGSLIFLCAAVNNAARWPIALALLVIGGGLAGWAGTRWRRARALSLDVITARITDLAATHDAELTLALIISELDVPEERARASLAHLEGQGLCRQEQRGDRTVYAFPGLKESKVVRRCAYCGSEYSVREPLHKCPNCGGELEIVKA